MKPIKSRHSIGILIGLISFFFNILQSVLLVPFIFRYWGNDNYSIWIILLGVINLFRTFDNGHQTYVGNEFGKFILLNPKYARITLGSSIKFATLIGLFQTFFFILILLSGLDVFLFGISFFNYSNAITFLLLFLWIIITSIGGVLAKILTVVGLYARAQIWGIIQKLCEISVLLIGIFLKLNFNLIFSLFVSTLILYTILALIDIRYLLPEFFPWWKDGNIKLGYKNFKKSLALTFNNFLEQFMLTSVNSSISNLFSTKIIPGYITLRTVGNVISQFSAIILQPLQIDFIKYHHSSKKNQIIFIVYYFWFFLYFFMFFPLLLFLPFLQPLYNLWTDGKILYNNNLTIAVISGVVIYNFGRSLIFYLSVINDVKALIANNIFRFLFIIPFSFLLGYFYNNIVAFAWGITVGEFIGSVLLPISYLFKYLNKYLNLKYVFLHILFLIVFIFILILVTMFYNTFFYVLSIFVLILFIIILFFITPTIFKRIFLQKIKKMKFNRKSI